MNKLLDSIKDKVGLFLMDKGYTKRGKNDFIKKEKLHKREEVISFSSRKGRTPHTDQTYIGVTSGIYYMEVNSLDKKIIQDFLNSYPIITGSIGHFKDTDNNFISIPINNSDQVESVANEIIENIKDGGFNLFNKFPTLESILKEIDNKHEWLNDYHKFKKIRRQVRISAMHLLVTDKSTAIQWFKENSLDTEKSKPEIIKKMEASW
ncbi:hypothetical protein D1815_07940 [Aquimarina sp. AD1]|uniref:hypothetical protein n=1 Tax=Aquimarina sp. (strain AD1) TaxID=1714848 RepID=UPI000E4EBF51|nr:hypothetical protein [Aquimarina sp. AD1]AXT55686.1 hypothetical protein D1815_07940 [Aquimarina sp. AD1]RKN28667.1 hypothetical protein D7035_07825 [Aquimarina sp. AD1]